MKKKKSETKRKTKKTDIFNPEPIMAEATQKAPPQMPKKPSNRGIFYLIVGIACFLVAVILIFLYFKTQQMIFGYIIFPPVGLGLWFIHLFRVRKEEITEVVYSTMPIPKEQVNSMNIYPAEKGGIKFEDMAKPEGQPRVCVNDSKPYFVHIWDEDKKRLAPFNLPDQQYYDPRVFAERVLELPAHRKIFQRKQTLLQKLSPFILILVIFAEWLIIITTTSPKGG